MSDRAPAQVAIIGGGPAGLIAAETLAESGLAVTVYDQRRSFGRKFLLAGRGGLNITHSEPLEDLLARYGPERARLEDAIRSFGPAALRAWCADHGEETFVGTSGRVFPESFRATPLLRSWLGRLDDLGVDMSPEHRWDGWTPTGGLRFERRDKTLVQITPDAAIFALGGASWPRVGGDGSWADTFRKSGIEVTELDAANCGVRVGWSTVMSDRFAGTPIKNATFSVEDRHVRGDAVVTEAGLEGGPIYAHSRSIRETPGGGLTVDLQPDLDHDALTARLSKRRPKASATSWLSSAGLAPVAVALMREVTSNELPDDPSAMATLIKAAPISVLSLTSIERAISTAGGVSFAEVDEHFMLKQRPGTFVAGEMLDWEAPTGGYLLQACFSTGVASAKGLLDWLT